MAGKNGVSLNWGGLDKAVGQAARRLADRKLLMDSIGESLVSGTLDRFQNEETPEGEKWEPSDRAWSEGIQDGGFGQTLSDTGILKKSIDYASTSSMVMVGSNVPYAKIHQLGGKAGRGHKVTIPARPYLGVSTADMEEVKATMADFLADAFRAK